jgi:AraC-like DNA-binding protein
VGYALWPVREVVYAYSVFLWCYAWTIVIVGWTRMNRYLRYISREYSNIDKIDVSWLRPVFLFAIIGQLAWLFTSLYSNITCDIVYYISVIVLWLVVLRYSWNFQPTVIKPEPAPSQRLSSPIAKGELERIVEEQQLYLNKNLMLQDLAQAMNTNRTYISSYLSQQRQQTFYDYINQLRIERVSIPLMKEHPEYKLDYVASESGFASLSTFRRAFIKLTGQTPGQKRDFTNN